MQLKNGLVVLGLATSHDNQNIAKRMQVRPGDQPGYPKDTIESFVGHSSMGLLCPPASKMQQLKTTKINHHRATGSFTSFQMFHTHTHKLTVLDLRVTVRVKSRGSPSGTCSATSLNLGWILFFVATKSSRALKV